MLTSAPRTFFCALGYISRGACCLRRWQVLTKCADDDGMITVIYGKTPTENMATKKVKADAGQVYCSSGTFGGDPVRLALRVFRAGVARWLVVGGCASLQ